MDKLHVVNIDIFLPNILGRYNRNMRDVMSRERYLVWYENCSNVDDVPSTVRKDCR